MDKKIGAIVKQFNPLSIYNNYDPDNNTYLNEIKIEFGDVYYTNPVINENDGSTKIMTPYEARMRNMSYSSACAVDFTVSIIKDPLGDATIIDTKKISKVNIGKIPIVVGSKYCMLSKQKNTKERTRMFI